MGVEGKGNAKSDPKKDAIIISGGRKCAPRKGKKTEQYNKIIGPYARNETPDNGNGQRLAQQCAENHMGPTNTLKRPPNARMGGKDRNRKSPRPITEHYLICGGIRNWEIPRCKNLERDYDAINRKYRSAVRGYIVPWWRASMAQQRQGTKTEVCLSKYKIQNRIPQETGVKYDTLG